MKIVVSAFLILVTLVQTAWTESFNVMTFNIRYNNPGDGVNAWPHRKDWVAEIVVKNKTDIAGFQEVRVEQMQDLKERLPDMNSYGVGRDDGKKGGEFASIFVRKSRFEILEKGTFWLSETPEKPSNGWDAALPRITSWVKLKDRHTATELYVLNTHFDHQGKEARLKSAELMIKRVHKQFADHPVIFMGDFNSKIDSPPYDTLVGKEKEHPILFDTYKHSAKPPEGPNSTWNGFKEIVPKSRIDFVFTTKTVNVLRLRTLDDQKNGRFPSDHLPVVVELEVKSK